MTQRVLQNSFLGGEISPAMFGRTDNDIYTIGASKIENFLIQPQGSIISRQGSQFVMQAKDSSKNVRLIPFRFASDQTLVLVFGHETLHIVTQGKILLNQDGSEYSIKTPYDAQDLFDLDFCQNADIVTITCVKYPPMELRRYGATDWRFQAVTTAPTISPPTIYATAYYPSGTEGADRNKVTARYVATAIDANGKESVASQVVEVKCNYYLTGGSVTISWSRVAGAVRYRVYRDVCGIFGFIGETDKLEVVDIGDNPDGTTTPPKYDQPYTATKPIIKVDVINGGSGYDEGLGGNNPTLKRLLKFPPFAFGRSYSTTQDRVNIKNTTIYLKILSNDGQREIKTVKIPSYIMWTGITGTHSWTETSNSDSPVGSYTRKRTDYTVFFAPLNMDENGFSVDVGEVTENNPRLKFCFWRDEDPSVPGRFDDFCSSTLLPTCAPSSYCHSSPSLSFTTQGFASWDTKKGSLSGFEGVGGDGGFGWWHSHLDKETMFKAFNSLSTNTMLCLSKSLYGYFGYMTASDFNSMVEIGFTQNTIPPTTIEVTDSTGSGALLIPKIENGRIVSVEVANGGSNYTSPTLTVKGGGGKGAVLRAYIGDNSNLETLDYPSAVTQYDQRRVFAGSMKHPLKVWFTNAGQQDLMMYHIPIQDDDRIEITAVTADADRIRHAVALDSLILFTSSGELRVFTQNSDALSPRSVAVRAQSYIGANGVQPVIVNNTIFYVASRGGHVRAVQYAYDQGGYTSSDLSLIANHLFDYKDINDMTLSKAPIQTVWAVSNDGSLLALTVYPDQNISCWSRLVTDGLYKSCCAVSEGMEDHLYVVVEREIKGVKKKYIERFSALTVKENSHARNLDCYLDHTNLEGTAVNGLAHLEGKTVSALIDGEEITGLVVTNGSVTLPRSGREVVIGLPYKCTLITLPLASSVARGNLQGSIKNINEVHVRVSKDGDLYANNYPHEILFEAQRDVSDLSDTNSKMLKLSLSGSWDVQGQIILEHRDALPIEIQAIVGNVRLEGAV